MPIFNLSESACQNAALTGGKAARLSKLSCRYPVPAGFCITDDTSASAIARAYKELSAREGIKNLAVAVRSSAADEDGMNASFAGQYKTCLNVSGETCVLKAVQQCFASSQSPQAMAYTAAHKKFSRSGFAVLVQKLITAQVSAVVFSVNPVTQNRDEIIINANWGLGESIVSGRVTADTYIVVKSEKSIKIKLLGEKHQRVTATVNGNGVVAEPTPPLLAAAFAMTDEQIFAIAQLALALENELGFAVDVECAWQDGRLYLLQCRPITTLRKNLL